MDGLRDEVIGAWNRRAQPEGEAPQAGQVAIPDRIQTKWLREIAQDAGFVLTRLDELVVPSPHYNAEPYLRRLLKLVARGTATERAAAQGEKAAAANAGGLTTEVLRALSDARAMAMKNVLAARIPECGDFGDIAQNLDWAIGQLVRDDRTPAADAGGQDAAVAAIQFALEDEDGLDFLSYWNEGEFDVIRRHWENVPEAVFIGADPLHPATRAAATSAGEQ